MKTVQLMCGLTLLANTALAVQAGGRARGWDVAFWAFVTFASALGGTAWAVAALVGPGGLVVDTERSLALWQCRGRRKRPPADRGVRLTHPSAPLVARGAEPRVRVGPGA